MKRILPVLARLWPAWLFFAALALAAFVFADALPSAGVLVSPDGMPTFTGPGFARRVMDWAHAPGKILNHDELLRMLLPPLAFHELSYMVSAALSALALAAYLRALGLAPLPCCAGGLAFAFAGYNFTLFAAGHRGYFDSMPYALLVFALVERAVRTPRAVSFLLAGACAVCGIAFQPDVMSFFLGLAIVYAVFRVLRLAAVEGAGACFRARWKGWALGVLLALVSFGVFGSGTLRHVFGEVVAGRKAQMGIAHAEEKNHAESAESADGKSHVESAEAAEGAESPDGRSPSRPERGSGAAEAPDEAELHRRWIFATNWSMPPEAVAEFVAPSFQGYDSGSREVPYWGRIGRSDGWEETHAGFANFRQHSLYVGAPAVGLALFALAAAVFAFVRVGGVRAPARDRDRAAAALFWGGAALVALLLALGRFGFLYRFFYKLPMMDLVRGPLKFVHLAELAAAVLAALGLAAALDAAARPAPLPGAPAAAQPPEWRRARLAGKVSMFAILALALACFAAALLFDPAAHAEEWAAAGLPATQPFRQAVFDLYRGAFLRGAWLLAAVAGFVGAATFLRGPRKARFCAVAGWVLAAVLGIDLALAARPYVQTLDAAPRFAEPLPAQALREASGPEGHGFSYLFLTGQRPVSSYQWPWLVAMDNAGFACRDPQQGDDASSARVKALIGFGDDFRRAWAFWGTAGVFAPTDLARRFLQAGLATPLRLYKVLPSQSDLRLAPAKTPDEAQVALLVPKALSPSVAVYHAWRGVGEGFDAALDAWKERDFDPAREIAVAGSESHASALAPEPARWADGGAPADHDWLACTILAEPSEPGMLFFRSRRIGSHPLEATVNGAPAAVHAANGHAFAVEVPAGPVEVRVRTRSAARPLATGIAGAAAFAALLALWLRSARKEDAA